MNQAPIIGITRCSRMHDYLASVERAGGRPHVLEPGDDEATRLAGIDGLLLTGGADVDPRLYGDPPHERVSLAEPGRDAFELGLAERAMSSGLPVLGICRGAQVMNVAAGGTLVQDIPSCLASGLAHDVREPIAHTVAVVPGSVLAHTLRGALVAGACGVNSRHHQSVRALGRGLIASAVADDGVIEAIEGQGGAFCLGVQWHPENFHETGEFLALFEALVQAADRRQRSAR